MDIKAEEKVRILVGVWICPQALPGFQIGNNQGFLDINNVTYKCIVPISAGLSVLLDNMPPCPSASQTLMSTQITWEYLEMKI